METKIKIGEIEFFEHPQYKSYYFSKDGEIYYSKTQNVSRGNLNRCSYYTYSMNKHHNTQLVHRLIWSCFNGVIPEGMEIDHIDNNRLNNKLENLQCITLKANRARRNIDMTKITGGNAHASKKIIKSMEYDEDSDTPFRSLYFKSKNQASKHYGISPSLVYQICEKKNVKFARKNGKVAFEYIPDDSVLQEEDFTIIPDKRIGTKYKTKKSAE